MENIVDLNKYKEKKDEEEFFKKLKQVTDQLQQELEVKMRFLKEVFEREKN